jgi:hypothetical protein
MKSGGHFKTGFCRHPERSEGSIQPGLSRFFAALRMTLLAFGRFEMPSRNQAGACGRALDDFGVGVILTL